MTSYINPFRLAVLMFAMALTACQVEPEKNDQLSSVDAPQDSASQPVGEGNQTAADSVLEGGFYAGDESDLAVDGQDEAPAEELGEPQAENSDGSIEDQNQALVESAGFSDANDAAADVIGEPAAPQRYCQQAEIDNEVTAAQACERISQRLASVSKSSCNSADLQPSQCRSVDGFPIFYREFAPLEGRDAQGRILVIGGIHGDELTSVSIVFKWIEKLNKFHSGLFHWHVVPMMNPDGVLPRSAQRTNKNGVDLNRNLPSDDWQENALKYWRNKQGENPRRYPGEQPASEPETQWLIDEINEFKPDAIISVHAPYGVVDFDALLLNTAPKSLGKLHLNLLGTYPGSLGNYAGIDRDIPVITLELPHAWEMPSEQETTKIWEDIVSWLRKNVNQELAEAGD